MPQLGETVAEGKIVKWFKSAGDAVKPGDNLFEIETDKTSMEVPATSAGTLSEIRFGVGEVAKVGAVVAVISGAGTSPSASPAAAPAKAPPPRAAAAPPLPRSAHARAQFRSRETPGRRVHDAAGAALGLRTRHRLVTRHRLRPAWPHRCQ